jgi:N-acetylneuraminic acid mutarotase
MKLLITISLSLFSLSLLAQITTNSQWTWMKGDNTANSAGVYGTLGVASPTNKPGAREGCGMNWTDASGNLWLYGDGGYDVNGSYGTLNDLWKYDPLSNQWTWVNGSNTVIAPTVYGTKGVAAAGNNPGARHLSTTWIDNSGDLWLFGGYGNAGTLNDMWKYNIASNMWTWMSGDNTANNYGVYGVQGVEAAANKPGARARACRPDTRADASGNFWIFGGYGYSSNNSAELNDLWKYNTVTNQWTWMSGDNTALGTGIYGTMGVPNPANKPGARVGGVCWIDTAGKFWLCGGSRQESGTWSPKFSDLWKYDPVTNMWTWMKGDNITDHYGVYGTKGVEAASNNPGGRLMGLCWIDNANNFWLFGGYGYPSASTANATGTQGLNDLWKYDPITNNWTWMKGDSIPNPANVYGTLGVTSPTNKPGNRSGTNQWRDANGNLWLFGGIDWGGTGPYRSDLWKLSKDAITWIGITSSNWTVDSNWSAGVVPGPNDEVIIPASTPYSPTVFDGTTAYCKDLLLLTGAILTVEPKAHLNIVH